MSKLNLSSMKIGPIYTVHLFLESTIFSFQVFKIFKSPLKRLL